MCLCNVRALLLASNENDKKCLYTTELFLTHSAHAPGVLQ